MKANNYDLSPEELADIGIDPDDHDEVGDVCVQYIFSEWSAELEDAQDICENILDNQRNGERFSGTLDRLLLENDPVALRLYDY